MDIGSKVIDIIAEQAILDPSDVTLESTFQGNITRIEDCLLSNDIDYFCTNIHFIIFLKKILKCV